MKKVCMKVMAIVFSIVFVFSVGVPVHASGNDEPIDTRVVTDATVSAGIAAIRYFAPSGAVIATGLQVMLDSFEKDGPSLTDISGQIHDLRNDIASQFADIKSQMTDYKEEIENKIVDQTVIAGKGTGFDKLLTALQGTDLQIQAINNDTTINDNEKAVEIASLIGKNTEWVKTNNLYFQYQDFMNTLSASSFASQQDKDLYQVVYDDCTLDSMFSGEALDKSRPYVERVILLGEYAYSINAQCLKAAQEVSQFTPEQVASLNDQELYNYKNVVSLTSVVNSQINDMCTHMYSMIREDSVVNHLETYSNMNRLVFVNYATESKNLSDTLRVGDLAEVGDYDQYNEVYDIVSNDGILKHDELNALVTHVRENYPGMTLREYLNSVGFNTDNLPQDTYIALAEANCYQMDAFPDSGGIGFKCRYNVSSVSIDDPDVTVKDRDLVTIVSRATGAYYPEKLTDGYVTNFTEAK